MIHEPHEILEGYDERQILHDGCRECEFRARDLRSAIAHLDTENFRRAWERAWEWEAKDRSDLNVSKAERELLGVLYMMRVQLIERTKMMEDEDRVPRASLKLVPTSEAGNTAPHVRLSVFAGPDADHRALTGTLTMLPEEALELTYQLRGAR